MIRIGLISDTHGLLRPKALAFLRGCDHIIHAGDIGSAQVIHELSALAPLTAVRGNNDEGPWADALPDATLVAFDNTSMYVIHDLSQLSSELESRGAHVIVSGHSHKPSIVQRDGIVYINPGSAGPRRFKLPVTIGEVVISRGAIKPRIVDIV